MKRSVVITSLNERHLLLATLESVKANAQGWEPFVVDDASDPPEPTFHMRNEVRQGVARSRNLAIRACGADMVAIMDAHMRVMPGVLDKAAALALERDALVYVGCNGHRAVELKWDHGILRCKWTKRYDKEEVVATTGMMGACYVASVDLLERVGGWVGLPGLWGFDEEAMSIHLRKCGVEVLAMPRLQCWHLFGRTPPYILPYNRYLINIAATHRMMFGDKMWARFKRLFEGGFYLDGVTLTIPEYVMQEVEGADLTAYGEALRKRHKLDDASFLEGAGLGCKCHSSPA